MYLAAKFCTVTNNSLQKDKINILAVSGSQRSGSSNEAVITTAAALVAGEVDVIIYRGLGSLPHFDGSVLISSPEYAFGVPGSLKNALDWTVSTGEFAGKPVALITAATGGDKAHASLLLTLTALSARVVEDATLLIPFVRSNINATNEISDGATIQAIKNIMDTFIQTIKDQN